MTRPTRALIDLSALRHNYNIARSVHGGRALAVLKANAYGHGAVQCAEALAGEVDGFAVAFVAEALELRSHGITNPILVLEGCFDQQDLDAAISKDLWIVVHQESQLSCIQKTSIEAARLNVWLKVDSGMHRAGFEPSRVKEVYAQLKACAGVGRITLMTHFACADEPDKSKTLEQIKIFDEATEGIAGDRSLCNSGGILAWPQAHRDWCRPGILLYGADPMPNRDHGLRPVMTLQSEVFAVRTLDPGESLGYGASFTADKPIRVGLVAVGYADGYPRTAPTGTPIAVDGKLTRTIGRVSMDMMTVDLTDLPEAGCGSIVECWGSLIDVNDVAQKAGTISYELLCNLKRAPKVYL